MEVYVIPLTKKMIEANYNGYYEKYEVKKCQCYEKDLCASYSKGNF